LDLVTSAHNAESSRGGEIFVAVVVCDSVYSGFDRRSAIALDHFSPYNVIERTPMNEHLDQIDNDIAEKHLLKHPFYLAWTRGD